MKVGRWLVGWFGVFQLMACAKNIDASAKPLVPAAEFYPLSVGNRWTYTGKFLGQKQDRTVEIVSASNGFYLDNQNGQLAADGYGVRDQLRYLLRDPLEAGRTWTNVVSVSSVEHFRIMEAGLSCEAPAGKFDNCVRVEVKNRVDEKTTLVNEMTFARGVGLVKVEIFADSSGKRIPQTQLLLRDYQLKSRD